jgi:hypothetical protein
MGILFKTYKGKHQLHICREVWNIKDKNNLNEILGLFSKKELVKAKIIPINNNSMDLELNGLIIDCKDLEDLKIKFCRIADLKQEYQKDLSEKKENKK